MTAVRAKTKPSCRCQMDDSGPIRALQNTSHATTGRNAAWWKKAERPFGWVSAPVHILLIEAKRRSCLTISKIDEMGAGMYKGKPKRMKQAGSGGQPEATGGSTRPMRSIYRRFTMSRKALDRRSVSRIVKIHGMVGTSHEMIAGHMTSMPRALRKHYRKELDQSKQKPTPQSAARCSTRPEAATTAMIFWMKTQAGWRGTGEPPRRRHPPTMISFEVEDGRARPDSSPEA